MNFWCTRKPHKLEILVLLQSPAFFSVTLTSTLLFRDPLADLATGATISPPLTSSTRYCRTRLQCHTSPVDVAAPTLDRVNVHITDKQTSSHLAPTVYLPTIILGAFRSIPHRWAHLGNA